VEEFAKKATEESKMVKGKSFIMCNTNASDDLYIHIFYSFSQFAEDVRVAAKISVGFLPLPHAKK